MGLLIVEESMFTLVIDMRELSSMRNGFGVTLNYVKTLNANKIIIIYILNCLEDKTPKLTSPK
jgi:hypothetical protein